MKIYFYKVLTFFIIFFIFYKVTIGLTIKEIKSNIDFMVSKENVEYIKKKLRDEMQNVDIKDRYISKEDAILINKFLNKIKSDLKAQ
tara:strand:- start:5462 stop:5722 length:261 start_codon:yes stop_codon:yes gene_type:complete